jgi:predicted GIY-YIG superfamily endonuclease
MIINQPVRRVFTTQQMAPARTRTKPAVNRDGVLPSASLPPTDRAFCCYIIGSTSDGWAGPYTGKTCNLKQRLHRHNHPSARSRAYTKGKGPWCVAAAVFGLRTNRQIVWLERALKHHAKCRACPAGLSAVQSAVLATVHVASRPSLWWVGSGSPPALGIHVFRRALQPCSMQHGATAGLLSESMLKRAVRQPENTEGAEPSNLAVCVHLHPCRDFPAVEEGEQN